MDTSKDFDFEKISIKCGHSYTRLFMNVFSFVEIPKSEIVGLYSKHTLNFIRNQLYFKMFVPFYIPTSNPRAYQLLHKFANNWNGIAILVGVCGITLWFVLRLFDY